MNYAHSCVRWTAEVDANGTAIEAETENVDSENDHRSDRDESADLIKS